MDKDKIKSSKLYKSIKENIFSDFDVKFKGVNYHTEPEVDKSEKYGEETVSFKVQDDGNSMIQIDVKNNNILRGVGIKDKGEVTVFHNFDKNGNKIKTEKLHDETLLYLSEMSEDEIEKLGLEGY